MRWQCCPEKLCSAQAFTPKLGWPSWLPVPGLYKQVHPPPKSQQEWEKQRSPKRNSTRSLTDVFSSTKWADAQIRNVKTLLEARRRKAPAGPPPSPRSRPRSCRLCKGGLLAMSRFSLFLTRFCSVPSGQRPVGGRERECEHSWREEEPGNSRRGRPQPPGRPLTGAPAAAETKQWLGHRLRLLFFVLPGAQLPQLRRSRA